MAAQLVSSYRSIWLNGALSYAASLLGTILSPPWSTWVNPYWPHARPTSIPPSQQLVWQLYMRFEDVSPTDFILVHLSVSQRRRLSRICENRQQYTSVDYSSLVRYWHQAFPFLPPAYSWKKPSVPSTVHTKLMLFLILNIQVDVTFPLSVCNNEEWESYCRQI